MNNFTSYRIAAAVPQVRPGNIGFNLQEIISCCEKASAHGAGIILFPELALTGAGCGDLFNNSKLRKETVHAVGKLKEYTRSNSLTVIAGFPLFFRGKIFNASGVFQNGELAVCCKSSVSNNVFSSARELSDISCTLGGEEICCAGKLLFEAGELRFGIVTGDDIFFPGNPSAALAEAGARIIFNPGAMAEVTAVSRERMDMLKMTSSQLAACLVTANAGTGEPASDYICGGRAAVFNNGRTVGSNTPLSFDSSLVFADVIPELLEQRRIARKAANPFASTEDIMTVSLGDVPVSPDLEELRLEANPFVPNDPAELALRCREILEIQSTALARRFTAAHARKLVIGLSGGLDSTWAFLVCVECCKKLQLPADTICAVTMPGFGTSGRTKSNAEKMAEVFGAELRVIPIADAVSAHFRDIGHDPDNHNVAYENSQARERTQILMDLANELSGIVVGTGDLSELALGWCTYNGDQMSMYGVNGSVPKTLMRHLVLAYADRCDAPGSALLRDVVNTPVSPELLPGAQHTEELIGSYDLHDFFIWYTVQYGADESFLLAAARKVFKGKFQEEEISSALQVFLRRFRTQQFKRNPMPDGISAGTLSLSPRGGWNAPSDC